ncbi:MAG: Type IV pilus assembly protein PilB [Candidatus Roizmanbacteria bacterium GW2011_GWA2_32_13]|uniref:Type IV pilus assembly protein PilB n=1 Tax=Candidatus Roizmanbacteria bacterium GW2011_GWA2_32_13 TaxID=1618475 RepID=A0A0F9ZF08_9BACT|nr:MAG: Type IV pilus assembly protein PilB [Candidatus Roizmanbacteria bacterium GW2011_GWA2_32_13]
MIISDEELKKLVIKNNLINEKGIVQILEYLKNSDTTFYDALIEKNIISDENLGILISDYLKMPFVILSKLSIAEDVFRIIPEKIARKHKIIPFLKDDKNLKVALANPNKKTLLEMVSRKSGLKIIPYLATERDISNTFFIYRKDLQVIFDQILQQEVYADMQSIIKEDAPIIKIVNLIIQYASQDKASDIHIEPQEKKCLIRFRIDGMLHDVVQLPINLHDRIVTRIKIVSNLRTDEHMSAQDGKMRFQDDEETMDIRVSILPIVDGEKAVLRLLSTHARQFSLIDLGMNEKDLAKLNESILKSYGMILSTGPTGSGKSTSIYAILKIINKREKNITTIEDPVEYRIKGVNQINVNVKTGLTFANGLRSILRQDPNIVFVGEIRDIETAGIAVNAALTGHLVLSTLHTNDAATALPRFIDMKVEPFLVASTVNVIIAQRLIRKICEMCKNSIIIPKEELIKNLPADIVVKNLGDIPEYTVFKGNGCKICHNTGYVGRIGIFEILEISKKIKALIVQKADSEMIAKQAIEEGMTTMLDDGLDKVKRGLTTLEEVLRVTKIGLS